ncbi:LysR family transcriptional regulator [Gymnodinialimonas ceratoperidinii]|uniref:LysR family transcriptional regulator n=1 Tax=Gymnodinialimonas ceratoperidinii TaxID=2856823 RepID=A0A8F6TWB3_9RHOB|nr:LysR family transcriptional regulator [Gymnodinialimonas ceratoperidinii]QXT38927.1 LysR family transcriptional regulator [Gymnodinialimonas ceratoperidinii]
MQIDQIETFLDLLDTGSFNRTADRLGVTQSTISGRVKALEKALGERLFERSRSGTQPTTAALRFEIHARVLRRAWADGRADVKPFGAAVMLRIGIQHDLIDNHVADWLAALRQALPDCGFYVDGDYSTQMCRDLETGTLDLGVVFTPRPSPDLYFESMGDVGYRMVSDAPRRLAEVTPADYILPSFAPAFSQTHATLLPGLSLGSVSSGQAAAVRGLFLALGGSTYLPDEMAQALIAEGTAHPVPDAPPITQPVFTAMHLRNRHRAGYRRLAKVLRGRLG